MKQIKPFFLRLTLSFTILLFVFIASNKILNSFIPLLGVFIFFFYKSYIFELRKRETIATLKKKRIKTIIFIFLVTWATLSALYIINNNLSFSEIKWFKPLIIGFGYAIIFVSIPIAVAEYTFMKERNKKKY
jgi:membrane-associated HD superfamily phosphohydrolase